jgi:hypothetical protein
MGVENMNNEISKFLAELQRNVDARMQKQLESDADASSAVICSTMAFFAELRDWAEERRMMWANE